MKQLRNFMETDFKIYVQPISFLVGSYSRPQYFLTNHLCRIRFTVWPFLSFADLIFATGVPRVIPVEKICNLEKFQMSVRCGEIWNLLHCVYDLWYFVAFWNIVVQYMGWEWPWSNRCPILPGCHLIYKNMKSIIMLRLLWNIFGDLRCFVAKSVCCDVHAIVRRKF